MIFSGRLLLCVLSAIGHLVIADVEGQHICVKFHLKHGKTASKTQESEPEFAAVTLKSSSSLPSGNPVRTTSVESEDKSSAASEGGRPPKTSGKIKEPGLLSSWQCVGVHCFISVAISGR